MRRGDKVKVQVDKGNHWLLVAATIYPWTLPPIDVHSTHVISVSDDLWFGLR